MEVRTIYVAFPGTSCEKTFETEEECLNYEKMETPEMWDEKGNPTFNGEEAMFIKVNKGMVQFLFDKYGKKNFPGLDEEDYGYFYWDDWYEQFHYLGRGVMKRVQIFMDKHEITSCSRGQGSGWKY